MPADKIAYVEIGSPDGDRRIGFGELAATGRAAACPTCSTASCSSSPARAASARPRSPPRWRCSPPSGASAPWCARSTPRATWPTSSRPARPASTPREVQPGLCAMSMDTEESLKEYLEPAAQASRSWPASARWPAPSTSWPTPRPGVKEILTVGKLCWEVRERHYDLVVVDAVGQRPHRRPAGGAAGASTSWSRSAWSATRPAGCSTSSSDPRQTGVGDRRQPPRRCRSTRRIELAEPARRRDRRRRSPPWWSTGCCPSCSAGARRRSSTACADADAVAAARRTRPAATCAPGPRRAPSWPSPCAAPGPCTSSACGTRCPPTLPLLYVPVPVRPHPRAAGHPPGGRGAGRGARATDGPTPAPPDAGPHHRAAAGGQGDRHRLRLGRRRQDHHRRRRWPPWPPSTSAARCSCSPSTRPGGWPTPSAWRRSATSRPACPHEAFAAAGVEPRGELWAAMLDTKQSWDDLVRRHAPERDDPRRHPRQPALPEHHRPSSCRATTTSPWSGCTRSTRRAATT